jgi:hypothetical protein
MIKTPSELSVRDSSARSQDLLRSAPYEASTDAGYAKNNALRNTAIHRGQGLADQYALPPGIGYAFMSEKGEAPSL